MKKRPRVAKVTKKQHQRRILIKRLKENDRLYKISITLITALLIFGVGIIGFRVAHSSLNTGLIVKDKTISNLSFKNARVDDNKLSVEVEALEDTELSTIDVIYKDSTGKEIERVSGYIGNNLKKGTKRILVVDTDSNLESVDSIDYEIIK